ncbi:MAG: hypothetical protein LQ342_008043 [Letrouitia transgressa]|nr:MAG: hypothetical protein LQ342_008043 [Letrouitia transgressa]
MTPNPVVAIDLQGKLPKLASGKVRDLFETDDRTLLLVASDRISAFDVIMNDGVPGKGALLTKMSVSQTVNGISLPAGLVDGQKLPTPLWTPSTKAKIGGKDENISQEEAYRSLGGRFGREIEKLSLEIYSIAAERTEEVGIILADTKFEFGADGENLVLIDEVLTPDSSRFWVKDTWEQNLGKQQPSFDKQFLRDWLLTNELKGQDWITIPKDVVMKSATMYQQACTKIVGS